MNTTETSRFVAELRSRILDGTLPAGTRLDAERELAAHYELSRTTIRAGLQALASEGMIQRKIGRNGGSFVTTPSGDTVTSSLQLVIGTGGIAERDLMETRLAIEPQCADLAATRMSEDEIGKLSAIQSEMTAAIRPVGNPADRPAFLRANARFHLHIAQGSHNHALSAILAGLIGPIEVLTDDPHLVGPGQLRELVQAHEHIFSAIKSRDGVRAADVMRKHLRAHIRLSNKH
ncbi:MULTISPECIES: FadR/GntR family transcriptional regulator [unclassified Brevibacterium]|uniref:FadR/GntR family transcriptional regulator n=1 Tax=unclassified Brevibacterium TaxID=2614124 RepID=UPI000C49A984|nr:MULTISPECIES: FCD domain-containing protein [unclassified Brevibacterium]SMX86908.1 DNA-binding transcriptional regulator, FadR family [Brevibacterium sp. 239c]